MGTSRQRREPAVARRAILATAGVLLLLVGIPAALILAAGNPLPEHLPTLDALRQALTRPDDGSLFLETLTLVGWLAWLTFTVPLLLEIPAQLRGVSAPRLPGLGMQQQMAATLIASIAALLPTAGSGAVALAATNATTQAAPASFSTSAAPATPAAHSAHQGRTQQNSTTADDPEQGHGSDSADARRTYTVQDGDSLWRIAAKELNDPTAWRAIAEANYGRPQSGGGELHGDHVLQPGWQLRLPNAAPAQSVDPDREQHTHIVRPGETLSEIAHDEMGSAADYPAIVEASADIAQPGGRHLADPGLIRPGWKLTIPAENEEQDQVSHPQQGEATRSSSTSIDRPGAEPGPEEDATPATPHAASPSRSAAGESETTPTEKESAPATSAPATASAPVTSAPVATSISSAQEPSPSEVASATDGSDNEFTAVDARTAAGTGALLAAGILSVIGVMRARQQHRRRPGQRIALPDEDTQITELELRAVEDPLGIAHIDAALRALAAHHRANGRPLPQLWAARLTGSHLELYLAEPARLPAPWAGTEDGIVWSIPHEDLPTEQAQIDVRAPYPSLVTIGQDVEDAHLMLDLEHITTLAIEGTPSETTATLAALAVELATSTWADDLLVTVVGCLPELSAAVPTGRLRHLDRVEELVLDLEQRAQEVIEVLADAGVPDILTARGLDVAQDAWAPEIVLLPGEIPDHLRDRLRQVLHHVPRVGVAVVTGGSAGLGEWALRYDTSRPGFAQLHPAGISLRPQTLRDPEFSQVLDLLSTTTKEPVPGPAWAAAIDVKEPTLDEIPTQRVGERDVVAVGSTPMRTAGGLQALDEQPPPTTDQPSAVAETPGQTERTHRRVRISPYSLEPTTEDLDVAAAPIDSAIAPNLPDDPAANAFKNTATETADPTRLPTLLPTFLPPPANDRAEEPDMADALPPGPPEHSTGGATIRQLPSRTPRLQLLGNVTVLDAGGPEPGTHLGRATTLVAYLACHRAGVTVEDIATALSPTKIMGPSTVWTLASRTRRWLGTDPAGRPYLPRAAEGGLLRLHPNLRTDWEEWLTFVGPDVTQTELPQLMQALQMVTGAPFSGVVRRYYGWAEPIHQEMISSIVDVAHEASGRAFRQGDVRAARMAAYIGRKADPSSERMWRAALRAEYLAGGADGTKPLVDQLLDFADELAADLEPETEELIAEINHRRGRAAGQ